ncbi:hypothetical protein [Parasitella parasitica]|uniref:Protein RER1 n=1 Tax=Parasitella parasitica TaxID=35722 RepID=A0A0B7N2N3_9FUNG|nr:hypothetical protein [Parasitella parasitica]
MNDFASEPSEGATSSLLAQKSQIERRFQQILDQVTPFTPYRWVGTTLLLVLFMLRVIYAEGWYIIAYALGIYILNLFLAFLTPKFDPSIEMDAQASEMEEGPSLPMKNDEEFKPFIRRLPEFKFWYSVTKATVISIICSLIPFFDIPVYWPILLMYFIILFGLTMRRQISHMVKYRYIPFDLAAFRRTTSSPHQDVLYKLNCGFLKSLQDDQSSLCMEKFNNPPRTLYDEIGQQEQDFNSATQDQNEDWKALVFRLQVENTSLVNSLHETNNNLMRSRREKEDLEAFIQRQTETTDSIVARLKETVTNLIENQKRQTYSQNKDTLHDEIMQEKDNQILDLIFQKKYLLMENDALKERYS